MKKCIHFKYHLLNKIHPKLSRSLSHDCGIQQGTSEDVPAIEDPSGSTPETGQNGQDLPEVIPVAGMEDAPTEDSKIDDEDDDDVVWSFSSPEERVVKEERPVIGSSS